MFYTAMFAHMEERAIYNVGDKLVTGSMIGKMGDTGQSFLAHVHLGTVNGKHKKIWTLRDIEEGLIISAPRELNYFLDHDFFQAPFKVTTPYCDFGYQRKFKKVHFAYDISTTKKWPWTFFWNRSSPGEVTFNDYDNAYGNCILIAYEN